MASSTSSSHTPHTPNPYGSRLLPAEPSSFLPNGPSPLSNNNNSSNSSTHNSGPGHEPDSNNSNNTQDDDSDFDDEGDDDLVGANDAGGGSSSTRLVPSDGASAEALVQPAPNPMPAPYVINQPTTHNTEPFSFGSQVDLICPKLLHDTVMSPVPQGLKFMCRIVRKNEGVDKRMYPTYELTLEEPSRSSRVRLLRATKKKRSRGSYYAITSDMDHHPADYDRKASDENYGVLGKLRSNFLGTAFNVYSNGRNPFSGNAAPVQAAAEAEGQSSGISNNSANNGGGGGGEGGARAAQDQKAKAEIKNPVRQELGAVIYNPNVLGLKGPRKMTILMNTMTAEGEMVERRPTQIKDTLIGRMTDRDMTDLLVLRNKSPQWNDGNPQGYNSNTGEHEDVYTNSFVLNFGGRVSLASVKNFQIVHDNDLDYIIMQFGKTSQDNFTMDCQYPMTPFQAFAFALTSFDAKLACE
ncbi:Tubby- protein 1 [Linnemannia schmuckeri]|uniref:Tubby- protein 1 n=1 Tax=Linnemannia schmuckeri TaxID=64567 RepID=A0A9P5V9V4_9FUNG|nr:Tubby- protein 1 [Linnemannia schmuckeri]